MKPWMIWITVFALSAAFSNEALAGGRRGGLLPAPRLFEPSEETDLEGKSELLFRWGTEGDRSLIKEYQFKLYKGTKTIESALLKTLTIPSSQDRMTLPSELFENKETYAWQLKGAGSSKTRPAFSIFRVKK